MWTVAYTSELGGGVREVYCTDEDELLSLVEVLQSSSKVIEFKVGRFLVQCKDGTFRFQGYSKWVERFSHEKD